MVYLGLLILIGTVVCLIKRMETRMVLLGAGFLMAIISGHPMDAFTGFTKSMTNANLVMNIVSIMGFAGVMNYTGCNAHMVRAATSVLKYVGPFAIPGVVIITFLINIALPSAAGCSAAVGAIMIPLLIGQGVKPAMAGSAVFMGTFGSLLSPGNTHNIFVADLTTKYATLVEGGATAMQPMTIMEVIAKHTAIDFIACGICAVSLLLIAIMCKENKGYVDTEGKYGLASEDFKINPVYAFIPVLPILLLVFGAKVFPYHIDFLVKAKLAVPHCMLIGAFLGMLVTRKNPADVTKKFWNDGGKGYGDVMGIIISAGVFTAGLKAIGVVASGIALMKASTSVATLAATIGSWGLAVLCGSGDAATLAFNQAITPHAPEFGMTIVNLGSLANVAGALGRTMSPLAGGAIVCAGLAMVNPFELMKRNALGCIIATIATYFFFVA